MYLPLSFLGENPSRLARLDFDGCLFLDRLVSECRKKAMVSMEGQFLVRQIYDDEITYNLIGAAVEILSK